MKNFQSNIPAHFNRVYKCEASSRAHVHSRINRNIVKGLILVRVLSSDFSFSLSMFLLSIQCNCTNESFQGHEDLVVRYSHGPTKTMSSNRTVLEKWAKGEREKDTPLHCAMKHVPPDGIEHDEMSMDVERRGRRDQNKYVCLCRRTSFTADGCL